MDDIKTSEIENAVASLRQAFEDYDKGLLARTRQIAPDFNVFSVIDALELPLSRMIGELLKPDGTHAQGRLFLDLFITSIFGNMDLLKEAKKISVELEYQIPSKGRIDILIDLNKKFGIAVENKPYAADQQTQIHRYHDYLAKKYGESKFQILYLSPNGSLPVEYSLPAQERKDLGDRFRVMKYSEIREWCNSCAVAARKAGAVRLSGLIDEFSEYISRKFSGVNTLKNKIMSEELERNILEAFKISQLWQSNKEQLETYWRETINRLVNEDLPRLVFEKLKRDGVIDDTWEWINGKFDISVLHIEGFRLKKKKWKHFEIGILSDRCRYEKGIRGFFPAVISNREIREEGYLAKYFEETGTVPIRNPFLQKPKTQWYANFPDENFVAWGYEQWKGIQPEGATVKYVADFLHRLINACAGDIDNEEER